MTAPDNLFLAGPPLKLQLRMGLARPGRLNPARRAALFVALAWLPLALLASIDGRLLPVPTHGGLLSDFGTMARFLVAGPLLLAAESVCGAILSAIAHRLACIALAAGANRARLDWIFASTARLRDAWLAEAAVALAAWAVSAAAIHAIPLEQLPAWHLSAPTDAARGVLSPPGWWYTLVSLPLLLALLFGWAWRLVLWTRFLLLVSRLDLHLVPVHPDRAAGIAFVGYSVRGFWLVACATGTIVAGTVANRVMHADAALMDFKLAIAGVVAFNVVLFTAPLLAFTARLLHAWREGVRDYTQLASTFGRQFELEWFADRAPAVNMLERGDFSAATDLYQVADRIHDLRLVPIDLLSLVALAGATLLPFVPVLLATLPLEAVLHAVVGLLR